MTESPRKGKNHRITDLSKTSSFPAKGLQESKNPTTRETKQTVSRKSVEFLHFSSIQRLFQRNCESMKHFWQKIGIGRLSLKGSFFLRESQEALPNKANSSVPSRQ